MHRHESQKEEKEWEAERERVGWRAGLSFSPHQAHTWSMMGGWEEEYFTVSRKAAWSFISFSLSLLVSIHVPFYCIFPLLSFWTPLSQCRNNDNLIILYEAGATRGGEVSKQPIYRAPPTDTEEEGEREREKQQNRKSAKDGQDVWTCIIHSILFNSCTHTLAHPHTHTHTRHLSI